MSSEKPGVLYAEIRDKIKTYDLFLFRGADFVSDTISGIEAITVGTGMFTHAGIAVWAKDLPVGSSFRREGDENSLYVLESTASGKLISAPMTIDNKAHLGVQLRNMDEVVPSYDSFPSSRMAWLPLREDVRPLPNPEMLQNILERYVNLFYDANCLDLLASAIPLFRLLRRLFHTTCIGCKHCCCSCRTRHTNKWYFCSELVAQIYIDVGIFPVMLKPENVIPADFLPKNFDGESSETPPKMGPTVDKDSQVPWVFHKVIRFKSQK